MINNVIIITILQNKKKKLLVLNYRVFMPLLTSFCEVAINKNKNNNKTKVAIFAHLQMSAANIPKD